MQNIPIQAIPNQKFSVPLDGNQWDVAIRAVNGSIAVTLTLNGAVVIENMHIVSGMRIIPSRYEESGNFTLITVNFEVPDYTKFGTTQQLLYASAIELTAQRIPTPGVLTVADFDQNAALPLRLFPQGYTLAP